MLYLQYLSCQRCIQGNVFNNKMLNDGNFKQVVKMNISSFYYVVPLFCQEKIFCFASRQKEIIQAIF
ncbi:conserved hypothetical protein [uncultured Citrobacter sp.]|uniref:Uncharacterized protein n=1 Tax=uncultured Citrobacter sp. TaxID=200446 RepID=A0A212IG38_9ENTR|nr:conserved hypothetical protein [uncultured Citrobacter sp.]SBV65693.1 conserved hypothetical protein [uncultured Citrobacter sp.]